MTISYREIMLEDANSAENIATKARAEAIPSLIEIYNNVERLQFYTTEVLNKSGFVALNELSEVIGFIIFVNGEIDHLYVQKNYRGMGIGQSLLDMAIGSMDSKEVFLFMFQENTRALDFYLKNGFEIEFAGDGTNNEERLADYKLTKAR